MARPDTMDSEVSAKVVPDVVLEATRGLLWINSRADARSLAVDLVEHLGGVVLPERLAGNDAVTVDLSFDEGEALVPAAARLSVPRMLLERHLPAFVEDAWRAIELVDRTFRLAEDASLDVLTGLANRQSLSRALGRLRAGDVVIMLDLDNLREVNDRLGQDEGDRVLQALGTTLLRQVRGRDRVGRYGGEEFVVVLENDADAEAFLRRLRSTWETDRPHPISFSAGIASATPDPESAVEAAEGAMARAKAGGRNRWDWAEDNDYAG